MVLDHKDGCLNSFPLNNTNCVKIATLAIQKFSIQNIRIFALTASAIKILYSCKTKVLQGY